MEKTRTLEALFNPASIAVVGASTDETKPGGRFLKSLIRHEFKGAIYAVNPNETTIMGRQAYPNVASVPGEIDLVVVAVPAQALPGIMTECAGKKVKFAIIFSAGFREIGDQGRTLEHDAIAAAQKGGVRIVGPNCMGIFNPEVGLNTIVAHMEDTFESGSLAFVGQSGWASENIVVKGYDRGLGFSKVISCGNQADLKVTDYLEYFGNDPKTAVVGAYMEGITDGRGFLNRAREASRKKPTVIWKAGNSDAGARAVASHTASLAGNDRVWDAALKQAGVARADHFDELVDFAVAFGSPFLPQGDRVGIIVEAGGGGASASDALEKTGLCIQEFSDPLRARMLACLQGVAAPFSSLKNPVDLVSPKRDEHPRIIPRLIELIASAVDTVLFFTYYPLVEKKFLQLLVALRDRIQKPIFIVPGYPTRQTEGMMLYNRCGIPALPTTERAARAVAALRRRAQWLNANQGPA